jgi:hypothetical protein
MYLDDLIKKLQDIREKHGDLYVITYDYAGGDHEEHEPTCEVVDNFDNRTYPIVILNK